VALLGLRRGRQPWLEELPREYDPAWIEQYWSRRPLRLISKFVGVVGGAGSFFLALKLDEALGRTEENEPERAIQARELVTDLGVAFIKLAQVWASRPDILPKVYNEAFEKLLEQVRPFDKEQAFVTLRRNVKDLEGLVEDMSCFEKPVASASVGQVYKARVSGRTVAVKVQRPDVREQITLDLYVIRQICQLGLLVPGDSPPIARQCRSTLELLKLAGPAWFEELDYQKEAANQRRFADTVANCDLISGNVVVPEVLVAKPEVLVQEWLDGKKLTEPGAAKENAKEVVTLLLNSYMVQFLETGYLHGDPHPGNFVVMPSGKLGILDYGLMTEIADDKRVSFIEYLMHLQAKDYGKCLDDLINLEFFPPGIRTDAEAREILVPALTDTLDTLFSEGGDLKKKQKEFARQREEAKQSGRLEELTTQLRGIAKRYGSFRLPSYFTLILRSFSLLEGLGLKQDENFSIVKECFPYISRRLLTDDSLRIREALRTYLYMGRSRVAVKRIDDLAKGFGTFTNVMKADRAQMLAGAAAAPRHAQAEAVPATSSGAAAPVVLDSAFRDIAEVVFSPDGNFLQDILIDEGVAAVDALSRTVLLRLIRTMGPLALPITLPLGFLFNTGARGDRLLARQDKEALLVLRRIAQLVQAPGAAAAEARAERTGNDLVSTARDLQRLQPLATGLLPTVAPGASAFSRRFAQQLARRILVRLAEDIERRAGVRPGVLVGSSP